MGIIQVSQESIVLIPKSILTPKIISLSYYLIYIKIYLYIIPLISVTAGSMKWSKAQIQRIPCIENTKLDTHTA